MKAARRKELTPGGVCRPITLEHLRGGTRVSWDDGCNAKGEPNQARQVILAMLRKEQRVEHEGETFAVPVYRLAKAPDPMPYDSNNQKHRARAAADRFDENHLKQQGDKGRAWIFPTPAWVDVRKALMAEDASLLASFDDRARASQGKQVTEILGQLMVMAEKQGGARGKTSQVSAGS